MAALEQCWKSCSVVLSEGVNGCGRTFKGITDLTVQGRCCTQTAVSDSTLVPSCYPLEKVDFPRIKCT